MATNQKYNDGVQFDVAASAVTAPADPSSGDPVLVEQLAAVALTDVYTAGDGVNRITIKTNGVYHLDVEANNGAIAVGHRVHIDSSTGAVTNTSAGGIELGYALEPVDSGATATIPVKLGF